MTRGGRSIGIKEGSQGTGLNDGGNGKPFVKRWEHCYRLWREIRAQPQAEDVSVLSITLIIWGWDEPLIRPKEMDP